MSNLTPGYGTSNSAGYGLSKSEIGLSYGLKTNNPFSTKTSQLVVSGRTPKTCSAKCPLEMRCTIKFSFMLVEINYGGDLALFDGYVIIVKF